MSARLEFFFNFLCSYDCLLGTQLRGVESDRLGHRFGASKLYAHASNFDSADLIGRPADQAVA